MNCRTPRMGSNVECTVRHRGFNLFAVCGSVLFSTHQNTTFSLSGAEHASRWGVTASPALEANSRHCVGKDSGSLLDLFPGRQCAVGRKDMRDLGVWGVHPTESNNRARVEITLRVSEAGVRWQWREERICKRLLCGLRPHTLPMQPPACAVPRPRLPCPQRNGHTPGLGGNDGM
jgi:hypothetical protein